MRNSKKAKVAQILPLIFCLSFHSKIIVAEDQNKKSSNIDSADENINSNSIPAIDEAFLMFLAEVDVQTGVELDPLDMLDVKLESANGSQPTKAKSVEVKQDQKIDKTKENR